MIHLYKNPEEIGALIESCMTEALALSPPHLGQDREYRQLLRQKVAVRVLRRLRERGELQGTISAE